MTATKVRNVRMSDEQWDGLLARALESGYTSRAEYVVRLSEGPLVVEVEREVVREKVVEVFVEKEAGDTGLISFDEAWAGLKKHQQNQINTLPGSLAALRVFHALSVGGGE